MMQIFFSPLPSHAPHAPRGRRARAPRAHTAPVAAAGCEKNHGPDIPAKKAHAAPPRRAGASARSPIPRSHHFSRSKGPWGMFFWSRPTQRNTQHTQKHAGARPPPPLAFFFPPPPPHAQTPPPLHADTLGHPERRARAREREGPFGQRAPRLVSLCAPFPFWNPTSSRSGKRSPGRGSRRAPLPFSSYLSTPGLACRLPPPPPPPPLALVPPPPFEARRAPSREALRRIAGPRGGVRARAGRAPNAARYCVCARACLFFEIPKCHRNQSKYYLTFSFSRALSPVARGERVQRARDGPPRDAPRRRSADISQLVESNRNRGSLGAAPLPHWHRQPTRP
jgi:hypothetical protein